MRKIISIIIINVALIAIVHGQSSALVSQLVALEIKHFESEDNKTKKNVLAEKINLEIDSAQYTALLAEDLQRLQTYPISPVQQQTLLYNQCLLALLQKKYEIATILLEDLKLKKDSFDTNDKILAAYLSILNYDTNQFNTYFTTLRIDTSEVILESSLNNEKKYLTLSALMPGLGIIALGKPLKGITALGLSAGMVTGTIFLLTKGFYITALTSGLAFTQKFYFGNIKLTESIFNRKNETVILNNKKMMLKKMDELLQIHPLDFKHIQNN